MDRLDVMRLFVRIVERGSFAAAAKDLSLPRSTVTEAIKRLEARLGARLLQRTTRHVAPTLDGESYYRSCLKVLSEVDEAEGRLSGQGPRGLLRIDIHPAMARVLFLPHLPAFLDRYPDLDLHIGDGDRLVDLVREGVDCVVRAGEPSEEGMIARRLGAFREATVASPAYLERHGTPLSPDELAGHATIAFVSSRTGEVMPLLFTVDGQVREVQLPSRVTVTGSDTAWTLARLGLGLFQAPRHRFAADFASGALVEVLADYSPPLMPVSVLFPYGRQLSPRVRVFVDWLVEIFRDLDLSGEAASRSKLR